MGDQLEVSLVMATRDKREYLALTLESLVVQTYRRFEVVLCDDGTVGGIEDVVAPFRDRLDLTVVVQENRGRAAARNAALAHVSGDLVVFIDDDRMASPDFVAAHAAAAGRDAGLIGWKRRALTWWRPGVLPLSRDDIARLVMRVGGRGRLAESFHLLEAGSLEADPDKALASVELGDERFNHPEVAEAFGIGLAGFRLAWGLATTANLSVPREAVKEVGGFDEAFTGWGMEDTDLGYRLQRLGVRFAMSTEAVNYHQIHPLADPDPVVGERLMHEQLMRNMDYFCCRHRSLDAYLFHRHCQRAITLLEADRLLKLVESQSDPLLRRELETLYAER